RSASQILRPTRGRSANLLVFLRRSTRTAGSDRRCLYLSSIGKFAAWRTDKTWMRVPSPFCNRCLHVPVPTETCCRKRIDGGLTACRRVPALEARLVGGGDGNGTQKSKTKSG